MTADEKAAILGVPRPSRRSLFKFGGGDASSAPPCSPPAAD